MQSQTHEGYNSQVAMTIKAGNQMKHKMLKLPNGQKKVYNDVFNAYLTPNSLDFLS